MTDTDPGCVSLFGGHMCGNPNSHHSGEHICHEGCGAAWVNADCDALMDAPGVNDG